MFSQMTSAATLGQLSIGVLLGVPLIALGVMYLAFALPHREQQAYTREPLSHTDLGEPGHYREPADPSYVDELIRVRGRFPAIPPVFAADPYAELADLGHADLPPVTPVYSMPLAQLVASARYRKPEPAPVHTHSAQAVDTAARHRETVGRHRALPELVAA